jgi:hypothetical protein
MNGFGKRTASHAAGKARASVFRFREGRGFEPCRQHPLRTYGTAHPGMPGGQARPDVGATG